MRKLSLFLLLMCISLPALADDSSASIGAGGLVVLKNEKRIAMAKEVLTIGLNKVKVDYEFRNDTDDSVTTMVAFPIPAYTWSADPKATPEQAGFDDFKLTIEGKPTKFTIEIRAKAKGKDVTALLKADGIDIASFGHDEDSSGPTFAEFDKLSAAQKAVLVKAGIVDSNIGEKDAGTKDDPIYSHPHWSVEKKYYWTQTFPPHSTVHISHEYTPVLGGNFVEKADFVAVAPNAPPEKLEAGTYRAFTVPELRSVCLSEPLRKHMVETAHDPNNDFRRIERPPVKTKDDFYAISFCWPGPVTKVSANEFKATATDLIPKSELRIGYFTY
jgi:hypothetical protein